MFRSLLSALACALLLAAPAEADDPEHGRAVVVGGGAGGREAACLGCHGVDGAGDLAAGYPRLAGLSPFYLYKQLKDYASGTRPDPVMGPVSRLLDDQAMRDVGAFYAGTRAPFGPVAADEALRRKGAEIATRACASCHGVAGEGLPPAIPALAGQHAPYLERQMVLWQHGVRRSDALGTMEWIARSLDAEAIRAVSLHYAALRPAPEPGS